MLLSRHWSLECAVRFSVHDVHDFVDRLSFHHIEGRYQGHTSSSRQGLYEPSKCAETRKYAAGGVGGRVATGSKKAVARTRRGPNSVFLWGKRVGKPEFSQKGVQPIATQYPA